MACDLYLQIDGVKGESTDSMHAGWIECHAISWGVSQPKSATASTGGGHTAERCEMTEILLTKEADMSSPILLQLCAAGKTIPRAKFEFMRADAGGAIKYYEIEPENVLVAHVAPSVGAGAICPKVWASSSPKAVEVLPAEDWRGHGRERDRRVGLGLKPLCIRPPRPPGTGSISLRTIYSMFRISRSCMSSGSLDLIVAVPN